MDDVPIGDNNGDGDAEGAVGGPTDVDSKEGNRRTRANESAPAPAQSENTYDILYNSMRGGGSLCPEEGTPCSDDSRPQDHCNHRTRMQNGLRRLEAIVDQQPSEDDQQPPEDDHQPPQDDQQPPEDNQQLSEADHQSPEDDHSPAEEEEEEMDFFDMDVSITSSSGDEQVLFTDSPTSEEDEDEDEDSNSTVMRDSGNEAAETIDHPLFHKEQPKHKWFVIDELTSRQLGYSARLQGRELFQRRCYGSLYSVKRLELMYKMEEHAGCVNSLNFHPDGTMLASGADDLKVVIWDWKLGKCLIKYKTKHRGNVFQSKFLPLSGDIHIASCARDGQVRLAQVSREEGVRNARLLGSHKGPCHKLIVLPEQPQVILSAGEDGVVLSHDVRDPKSTKIVSLKVDDREVALYSIHGHPLKSNEFCICGRDPIVRVYDQRKSNKPASTYMPFQKTRGKPKNRNHVTCAVYNWNGSEILASYSDADVYLFDVNNSTPGHFLHQYQGHRNAATIKGVNFFGPKSEFVVSGSDCGHIYFWERNTEALVQWLLADDNGVVNCLEPHPQLPFICTSGLDWDVKVWVPSCEKEPSMAGLKKTVQANTKSKGGYSERSDVNESQMLWMLWRHLRNSNRARNSMLFTSDEIVNPYQDSNSSESESVSSPSDSEEEFNRAPNCTTS